jgi:hypothetical protein
MQLPRYYGEITKRLDGTYVINENGLPYHVTQGRPLFSEVEAYAQDHPDKVTQEQPPTLAEIKAAKWNEIGAVYDEFDRTGTVETSLEYPIQVGQAHLEKLDGAIRYAEMTERESIYITDANDVTHYGVSLANAKMVLLEAMAAALAAHQQKQALRAAVTAAETAEDVEAISWDE